MKQPINSKQQLEALALQEQDNKENLKDLLASLELHKKEIISLEIKKIKCEIWKVIEGTEGNTTKIHRLQEIEKAKYQR